MRTGATARIPTHAWVLAMLAMPTLAMPAACTLLLSDETVQCADNSSCTRFPNSVCDITSGVCVAHPGFPDAGGADLSADAVPVDQVPVVDAGPTERNAPPDATASVDRVGSSDAPAPAGCPDLDRNSIPDCRESLVANPDFASNTMGWTTELGVTQVASGTVPGGPASGALGIVNANQSSASGSSMAGSMQCLTARAEVAYALFAEVLIPLDQDPSTLAGVAMQSYPTTDCSGSANAVVSPSLISASGASANWQLVQVMLPTPAGSGSLSVRLVVVKPFSKGTAQAFFDNVLVKAR